MSAYAAKYPYNHVYESESGHLIEQDDFPKNTPGTMWGVFDEHLFKYAENILDTAKISSLITLFTTTNHQPWEIPENKNNTP